LNIDEAPIPSSVREAVRRMGVSQLYPPQAQALSRGLLDGRRLVVATPTASGKTLIAMMAAYNHLMRGGKCLYLTPLRALAAEKLDEFKTLLIDDGFRPIASTGDYDSSDPWLASYDVIVATNEKADSLIRHRAPWIDHLTLVVADEIHMLGDSDRGATLEMTLTRLLDRLPGTQFLALSATARNASEIAEWLGADLVSMDWRPVPLKEGVATGGKIVFADGQTHELGELDYDPAISLALETVADGGQALIFANTRRKAETYAERAAAALTRLGSLTAGERDELGMLAGQLSEMVEKSGFTEKVTKLMTHGSCFHHAGLGFHHRRTVEKAFRKGLLKILAATPTLAAGVNLPARTVIIPELWRYDVEHGRHHISVTEYKQFCGRAGRPGFDKVGYALTIARRDEEAEIILEKYIRGRPERIWSRLGNERMLRTHILAVLASDSQYPYDRLEALFKKTFFAYQYGVQGVPAKIGDAINFLAEHNFVKRQDDYLEATALGKRVAELYIDPLTAIRYLKLTENPPKLLIDVSLLQVICSSSEVPSIPLRKVRDVHIESFMQEYGDCFFPNPWIDEEFTEILKTVMILKAWIEEASEAELYERFGLEPGDIIALRERCSWLAYAASQLMKIVDRGRLSRMFQTLSARIDYGVREELLALTSLEGVGRVRARNLYMRGYRTLEDLRKASFEELARVPSIGVTLAEKIKSQLSPSSQNP
jgi:helicase